MSEVNPEHKPCDGSKIWPRTPFFYGWVIVGIVFLDSVVVGSHHNIFAVLIEPMTGEMDWTKTQLIGVLTVSAFASGLAGPIIGPMIDRYGPRMPLAIASLVGGFLLLGVAGIANLWQFYVLYGLLFGLLRPSLSELIGTVTVAQWFVRRRGIAFAFTSLSSPFGAAVMVPLAQIIITQYGWRGVWIGLAVLMWCMVCVPGFIFMRHRPEDIGLHPDGIKLSSKNVSGTGTPPLIVEEISWPAKDAIKTSAFWLIIMASTFSGSMAGPTVMLYLVVYVTSKGLTPQVAAASISFAALGLVISRPLWALISTRLDVRHSFMLYGVVSAGSIVLVMLSSPSTIILFPVITLMGSMLGGAAVLFNLVWPEYFGRHSIGAIRGYASPVQAVGRGIGPLLVAMIFDATKSYQLGFGLFAMWYLLAALMMVMAKRPVMLKPASDDNLAPRDQVDNSTSS